MSLTVCAASRMGHSIGGDATKELDKDIKISIVIIWCHSVCQIFVNI